MSKIEVNTIEPQSGTTVTVGASGDTITIPSGATLDASNATTTLPANVVTTDGTQTLTNKTINASQLTGTITPSDNTVTNAKINYPLAESGAVVSTFNRTTSDGTILELQKDGTKSADIGTVAGGIAFISGGVSTGTGLQLNNSANQIRPCDNTGAARDNAVTLGDATRRWQDLYLGGGLYVGGTGSANKLEDYEEGTFTPSFSDGNGFGSLSYVAQRGVYTKIGRIVNVRIQIELGSGVTKNNNRVIMDGLPFTSSNALPGTGLNWSYVNSKVIGSTTTNTPTLWIPLNSNAINWYKTDGSSFIGNDTSGSTTNMDIYINGTYQTDA